MISELIEIGEMIELLQRIIRIIIAVMVGIVVIYFYVMKKSHTNNTYKTENYSSNNNFEKMDIDDSLNSYDGDDGPIKHL